MFSATTFPKLRICSHSQHSLAKVQKLYPDLDPEIMQKLYGFASSREEKDLWNKLVITKDRFYSLKTDEFSLKTGKYRQRQKLVNKMPIKWPGTNDINMTEFFTTTSPK